MDKEKLLKIVQSWNTNKEPEYRGFGVPIVKDTFARLGIFGLITKGSNVKFICVRSVLENTKMKQN
jgi:hypothetical protein